MNSNPECIYTDGADGHESVRATAGLSETALDVCRGIREERSLGAQLSDSAAEIRGDEMKMGNVGDQEANASGRCVGRNVGKFEESSSDNNKDRSKESGKDSDKDRSMDNSKDRSKDSNKNVKEESTTMNNDQQFEDLIAAKIASAAGTSTRRNLSRNNSTDNSICSGASCGAGRMAPPVSRSGNSMRRLESQPSNRTVRSDFARTYSQSGDGDSFWNGCSRQNLTRSPSNGAARSATAQTLATEDSITTIENAVSSRTVGSTPATSATSTESTPTPPHSDLPPSSPRRFLRSQRQQKSMNNLTPSRRNLANQSNSTHDVVGTSGFVLSVRNLLLHHADSVRSFQTSAASNHNSNRNLNQASSANGGNYDISGSDISGVVATYGLQRGGANETNCNNNITNPTSLINSLGHNKSDPTNKQQLQDKKMQRDQAVTFVENRLKGYDKKDNHCNTVTVVDYSSSKDNSSRSCSLRSYGGVGRLHSISDPLSPFTYGHGNYLDDNMSGPYAYGNNGNISSDDIPYFYDAGIKDDNENLAIAVPVTDSEPNMEVIEAADGVIYVNNRFMPAAVEFDPDSKISARHAGSSDSYKCFCIRFQNRRVLYVTFAIVLIVVTLSVSTGIILSNHNRNASNMSSDDNSHQTRRNRIEEFVLRQIVSELDKAELTDDDNDGDAVYSSINTRSSYKKALDWIANMDPLVLSVSSTSAVKSLPNLLQRFILVYAYYEMQIDVWHNDCREAFQLNGTIAPLSTSLSSCDLLHIGSSDDVDAGTSRFKRVKVEREWLSGFSECDWVGIKCDLGGHIIELNIRNWNAVGLFPRGLFYLPHLAGIDLQSCALHGPVPTVQQLHAMSPQAPLGVGKHVQRWNLQENFVTGILSPPQSALPRSKANDPVYSGEGDLSCIMSLRSLTEMFFEKCRFTGPLPTFASLTNSTLDTNAFNRLNFLSWKDIKFLNFGYNQFTGSLSGNGDENEQHSGVVFSLLQQAKSIHDLILQGNNLTGTIPSWLFHQRPYLQAINLNRNKITGTIPNDIGLTTYLTEIRLSDNLLTGSIPEALFTNVTSLMDLFLNNNYNMNGTISTNIGNLKFLTNLDLSNNQFSGTVPPELASSNYISSIQIKNNNFTGTIPTNICERRSIYQLTTISADCLPPSATMTRQQQQPQILCQTMCCTECCTADGDTCQDMVEGEI